MPSLRPLPKTLFSGYQGNNHCQGIAVDPKGGFIYYSFTTRLVKTDLAGHPVGSVEGLCGHLGCIDFNERDGRVYGSLEYKNDRIGKSILQKLNRSDPVPDAFYCAIFDVDRIDRPGMQAESDGIMRAVYLKEVVQDYNGETVIGKVRYPHQYGCSGIDGTGWGPVPGTDRYRLHICYGIYGEPERPDNDYQIILSYNAEEFWDRYAQPLNQEAMHRSGPDKCEARYFLYTGNTTYGVQNLEYDSYTGNWFAAVYPGRKPKFENPPLFVIDGKTPPVSGVHPFTGESILQWTLLAPDGKKESPGGLFFPHGSTGMYAAGDGRYLFSEAGQDASGQFTRVRLYHLDPTDKNWFLPVS